MTPETIIYIISAPLFGAVIGSFLNVVILRIPNGGSIMFPASHCPKCDTPLSWFDNIPVLSYLILRGKCRYCKTRISVQYPLVEACMAIVSLLSMALFGLSIIFGLLFVLSAISLVAGGILLNKEKT